MTSNRLLSTLLSGLLLLLMMSCQRERRTNVHVADHNGPEFRLTGSGTLQYFVVYSPLYAAKAREPNDLSLAVWLVSPSGDPKPLEEVSAIHYGTVPDGYKQEYPNGKSPETLVEGQQYYFHVDTRNAPGFSSYVAIHGGKAVLVDGPHVCFGIENGKWFRKPCVSQ